MNTFVWDREFATLGNLDGLLWLIAGILLQILDLINDFEALEDLAEYDVSAIEPCRGDSSDEELAAICILSAVGHGQEAFTSMLELEVLVREFGAVDGLATSSWTILESCAKEK
jgi:hypothetical protein